METIPKWISGEIEPTPQDHSKATYTKMISKKQVQHIAKLARISLTLKEQEKFQKDLSSIFDYFKELEKLEHN